jgi:nickel-dependent lactate racemase
MDRNGWKPVKVEYGQSSFQVFIPETGDVLSMKRVPALSSPRSYIEDALSNPVSGPGVSAIIANLKKPAHEVCVGIAVSDNTRPVPYSAERDDGILLPLLHMLESEGIQPRNIKIIVATGTHKPTTDSWKLQAFGKKIIHGYDIVDHDCNAHDLVELADIEEIPVRINSHFYHADLRIVTGLVEPHFMAGFSGGRKSVCPGLVNLEVLHLFHSAEFMGNPHATNLVLKGNPCHEFALKVARHVGVHFTINVALNSEMQLAGIWAGDLALSHERAVATVRGWAEIPTEQEYDVVLTHGGRVAVNHYQAVKAACSVIPIVRSGGVVVLAARNSDAEPVGKRDYRQLLQVLRREGPGSFSKLLMGEQWSFVPDQWEVQKLDQFFMKVGSFDGLIYCTTGIDAEELGKLPGKSGYDVAGTDNVDIKTMVQDAIDYAVTAYDVKEPRIAYVEDGPYVCPVLRSQGGEG